MSNTGVDKDRIMYRLTTNSEKVRRNCKFWKKIPHKKSHHNRTWDTCEFGPRELPSLDDRKSSSRRKDRRESGNQLPPKLQGHPGRTGSRNFTSIGFVDESDVRKVNDRQIILQYQRRLVDGIQVRVLYGDGNYGRAIYYKIVWRPKTCPRAMVQDEGYAETRSLWI